MGPTSSAERAEAIGADERTHEHALLEFAVLTSPAIFYVADYEAPGRPLRYISANVETLTGHPRDAWRTDPDFGRRFVHPDDLPAFERELDTLAERGAITREYRFRARDGRWLWFRDALRLTRNEETGRAEFVGCMIDITEEKRVHARLDESEAHFRSIFDNAPICIHEIDREGRVASMNPKGLRMLGGGDPARVLGRPYVDFVARDDRERVGALIARALAGERVDFEFTVPGPPRRHFLTAKFPVHGEGGGVEKLIGITVNITDRIEREAELRQGREILEDAIESLTEGFALYDADDRLVMCNRVYRELNEAGAEMIERGVRYEDLIRALVRRGQYPDAAGREEEWVRERLAERDDPAPKLVRQSDGRWFERSSRRTRQGGTVVVRSEVTRRVEMEQALRESEELIRRMVEACPVPIGMTRVDDGRILYESPGSQALFGIDPATAPASTLARFVDPEDRERYVDRLRATGAVDRFEVELRKVDGATFPAEISARLIEYQGEPVIVSSTFDLTEHREVEAEMRRQRELLHQSEKLSALGELLAGIAHELNNPLSVVVGQALLLKETAGDPRLVERARRIGDAADRCTRIVRTFLAMARQQPGESRLVDVNDVVESALEVTGYGLRANDIDVSLRLARELPPVWADPSQLSQVLVNLVVNAQHVLEGLEGPRRLRISTGYRRRGRRVVVKVKDNGPGIPPEHRSRVFDPFFTTKDVGKGTGIGLSVCHRIVESHGGTIELESASGGAVFTIRLPAADASSSDAEAGDGAPATPPAAKRGGR